MCSVSSSSQRENSNAIFASEKRDNLESLVGAVANMKINDVRYEFNTAITSEAKVEFSSDPDKSTHASNRITHKILLSSRTIDIHQKYIFVFLFLVDSKIVANNQTALLIITGVVQAPQALLSSGLQETIVEAASNRKIKTGIRSKLLGLV